MANSITAPALAEGSSRITAAQLLLGSAAAPVTYYYRTSGGTRGSTTDPSAIPVGAVLERRA